MKGRRVAIIGGNRTPFARSFGSYMGATNQELMTSALAGLVSRFQLEDLEGGEAAFGCVLKHSSDWNFSREVVLGSRLSPETPAYDVVQACGTSLEAAIVIANKIAVGQIDWGVAGGSDTNSDVPFVFSRNFNQIMLKLNRAKTLAEKAKVLLSLSPRDIKPQAPVVVEPRTFLSMGQSCEKMAKEWKLNRQDQDQLALESHQKSVQAQETGFYMDLMSEFNGVRKDQVPRADTTLEKLARLKPAFDRSNEGTLTAGNSSALTDGAACVLLASEDWAKTRGLEVLAYLSFSEVAAVNFVGGEGLLMAPAYAVPRMLKRAQLKLQDFDLYEIHEAFAAQVLCTLRAWESDDFCRSRLGLEAALGSIDRTKMNLKGGSVALGHPFAATGARILAGLAKQLKERGGGRGLISICTGGGMGVTAIVDRGI